MWSPSCNPCACRAAVPAVSWKVFAGDCGSPRLGIVLHFLCTGTTLFHMDAKDDNLIPGSPDEARLKAWKQPQGSSCIAHSTNQIPFSHIPF